VLATLDPTFAQADVAQLSARQRSLLAQLQRMEAELAGQPFDAGDGSDPERRLQASLYAQRKADFSARMAAFEEDIRRQEASIRSAQSEADGLKQQLAVVHEVVNMRETLLHSQTGSKLNALDAQNLSIRTQREYNAAINKQTESRFAVASRQAEQRSFAEQWRRETMEKLVAARDEAAKVNEDLVKASRMRDLVQLVAPADAVVVEIAKRSLGSVLREAEPLITLVAASSPLMAEIDLASADIGYAQPGDPVQIKIDAFPYQRHGMIEGRLTNIAMESVSPDGQGGRASGGPQIHHGQVELTSLKLDNLPDGIAPIPGMTINAEIKVGTRSVMSYFLYPVIRGLGESIREP
ncbi:MAG TPA: HlyD family type I secretion periplasmic adaptor subunit, partial [Magnetospirillum sp.]|nr:HlyD family type I secretion periplasmic adaptor subunit [Magnetospirillum sp.]